MERSFLQAICDDPDDLVSRRVFADWLSEQDGPAAQDRAEFLRLQLDPTERHKSATRQRELLKTYRVAWEKDVYPLATSCSYHDGFAERVTLNVEQLVFGLEELAQWTPVVRVGLTGLTLDTAAEVAACPALAHVRELDLTSKGIAAPTLGVLLRSPHLTCLRYLNLSRNPVGEDGVNALVASAVFPRLRYLNLSHASLNQRAVRALLAAVAFNGEAMQKLAIVGAPRATAGGHYPALPETRPVSLRQSVASSVGVPLSRPSLLRHFWLARTTLPDGPRRWVEELHKHGTKHLPRLLTLLSLPADVHRAFAAVCLRRAVWRASRTQSPLPALPAKLDVDPADLARAVGTLMNMGGPEAEAVGLTECLLGLYAAYHNGDITADGRTR